MGRKILAVIAGYIASMLVIFAVEAIGHYLYPLPEGMDRYDPNTFKVYAETAPFIALFLIIVGYASGAFTAGFVSTKIAADNKNTYAIICGAILLICTIVNMFLIPSPIWFMTLAILACFFVFLGYRLAVNKN